MEKKMNDSKKFEHVRIIANPLSSSKTLDADVMIENILSKKQIFVKKSLNSFPLWLTPGSTKIPALFDQVWKVVQCTTNPGFCNTPILSQILLSSGLSTQILGFIWNLVNKKSIGILSEEELYLTLALIAISQNGTVVQDLDILKHIQDPLIPRLDHNLIKQFATIKCYPNSGIQSATNFPQTQTSNEVMKNSNGGQYNISTISRPNIFGAQSQTTTNFHGTPENVRKHSSGHTSLEYTLNTITPQNNIQGVHLTDNNMNTSLSSNSWGNANEEDDEFSDFQSSVVQLNQNPSTNISKSNTQNVSIILNPIDYFMSPSLNSVPSYVKPSNLKTTSITSSSFSFTNNKMPPSEPSMNNKNSTHEEDDDDFTEFQSSTVSNLDFDVEIKQPNILKNIKTIIDGKQDILKDQQTLLKSNENSMHEMIIGNNEKELNETNMQTEEKKILMTERDYSALKEIQIEQSLFDQKQNTEMENNINVFQPTNEDKTNSNVTVNVNDASNSLLSEQHLNGSSFGNMKFDGLSYMSDNFSSIFNNNTNSVQNSKSIFRALDPKSNKPIEDDEFTDFAQAMPETNYKINFTSSQPIYDSNLLPSFDINSGIPNVNEDYIENNVNSGDHQVLKESTETTPSHTNNNDSFFSVFNNDNTNLDKARRDKLKSSDNVFDNFTDFKQATINISESKQSDIDIFQNKLVENLSVFTHEKNNLIEINKTELHSDDEFTDFEQAPIIIPTEIIYDKGISDSHRSDTIDNDLTEGMEDKYSAFRKLDLIGEDVDDEYDEKVASDEDNTSLQLPSIGSHEQDGVQTKCYDACIYTLETSLNLFLSSQVEHSVLSQPKVIEHLKCLLEIYQVGKRLQKYGGLTISNSKLDSIWSALSAHCSEATSFEFYQCEANLKEDSVDAGGDRCEICLSNQNSSDIIEENNQKYHVQCANLYLNCVESTLP